MTFMPIDYFFCILIVIFALVAFVKGFISDVMGKLAWILGIIGAVLFYMVISKSLSDKISNALICNILGFLIVFTVIFLAVKILEMILNTVFEHKVLKSLDRGLGLIFGLAEGFAIVCLIIFLLSVQPFFNIGNLLSGSFFVRLMNIVLTSDAVKSVKGGK